MIRKVFPMLIAAMLVFGIATLASARGAPNQKTDAAQAATVDIPVMTAATPQMTGYDVIQNLSETRALFRVQNSFGSRLIGATELSPTRALCSGFSNEPSTVKRAPAVVMLA